MGSNSLNKTNFYFICTNYSSTKDGIGHYTSNIVKELKKDKLLNIYVYSANTFSLSKLYLFFSLKMTVSLLQVLKIIFRNRNKNFIVLEYPFVEYNPIIFLALFFVKILKHKNSKIVISLHEYSRTKKLRKFFIKHLISFSDIVLFTKELDVESFLKKDIYFKKRVIPTNIEPQSRVIPILNDKIINVCFFGIINFETKEIGNMIKGWNLYSNEKTKIKFHVISSSFDITISNDLSINYHYDLNDKEVSNLLSNMQFIILPLKPEISINNASLVAGCIHKCVPVGIFDSDFFDNNFGIIMKNYEINEFVKVFRIINNLNTSNFEKKRDLAYSFGASNSISKTASSYKELISL